MLQIHYKNHLYNYYLDNNPPSSPVEKRPNGSWYILMGFAGFNSHANNRGGYNSEDDALSAIRYYQSRPRKK